MIAEITDAAFERFQDPRILREHGLSFEGASAEVVSLIRAAVTI